MRTRFIGALAAVCAVLALIGAGSALATAAHSAKAYVPPGQPVIPGVTYWHGAGAPYLSTQGAPITLAGDGIGQYGGAAQATATKLGTQAGDKLGKIKKSKKITVGFLQIIGGIQSADRVYNAMRVASLDIGAKTLYCDAQGTATGSDTCANTLISEHPSVIVTDSPAGADVFSAAAAAGIPVISVSGNNGPGFATDFYPNETKAGVILAKYVAAKVKSGDVMEAAYPGTPYTQRTAALTSLLASDTSLKLVDTYSIDAANLVAGTEAAVSSELTADPNLALIWADFDTAGQAVGQEVATLNPAHKPVVVTFHADPATQALMREGDINAVVDTNYDASCWLAANAIVEHFDRGTPWPAYTDTTNLPGIGNVFEYDIVTGSDLPAVNHYVAPKYDVDSYFIAKWKAEGFVK